VSLEALRQALSEELGAEVTTETLWRVVRRARRLELKGDAVRTRDQAGGHRLHATPDILYHACTTQQVRSYEAAGAVRLESRSIFLSDDETQAWRVAHRLRGEPRVLYVDTARHRRRRLRLQRSRRSGLYIARSLPLTDVLNLQPRFEEQRSAGGIPVLRGEDGQWRMALIRVVRRSGVTWEVAKGKLEAGEPPEWAGIREVREEMGVDNDFSVRGLVGLVRYGFLAPGGLPRLKTIYLYLLEPIGPMESLFRPSEREGIRDVRWFTTDEAIAAVTHTSLRPLMRRARELIES
jgi:8-oxo-dGTP pyrophosphatase MutT (NUDIX family)